jgi:nicotinate-nucleotide pyrophosphorylase
MLMASEAAAACRESGNVPAAAMAAVAVNNVRLVSMSFLLKMAED